jgi:hypothetical protein
VAGLQADNLSQPDCSECFSFIILFPFFFESFMLTTPAKARISSLSGGESGDG